MLADQDIVYVPDIIYGKVPGKDLLLDITMPKNRTSERLPAIIYLHGGGWETGDKAAILGKGSSRFFAKMNILL